MMEEVEEKGNLFSLPTDIPVDSSTWGGLTTALESMICSSSVPKF